MRFTIQGVEPRGGGDRRRPGALDYAYLLGPCLTILPLPALVYLLGTDSAVPDRMALLAAVALGAVGVVGWFLLLREPVWRGTALETLRVAALALPWGLLLFMGGLGALGSTPPPWVVVPLPVVCATCALGGSVMGSWALRLRGFDETTPANETTSAREHVRAWSQRPAVAAALGVMLPGLGHLALGHRRRGLGFLTGSVGLNLVILLVWLARLRQVGLFSRPDPLTPSGIVEAVGAGWVAGLVGFTLAWNAFLVWQARDAYRSAQA